MAQFSTFVLNSLHHAKTNNLRPISYIKHYLTDAEKCHDYHESQPVHLHNIERERDHASTWHNPKFITPQKSGHKVVS